jgi:hypothetical protein
VLCALEGPQVSTRVEPVVGWYVTWSEAGKGEFRCVLLSFVMMLGFLNDALASYALYYDGDSLQLMVPPTQKLSLAAEVFKMLKANAETS